MNNSNPTTTEILKYGRRMGATHLTFVKNDSETTPVLTIYLAKNSKGEVELSKEHVKGAMNLNQNIMHQFHAPLETIMSFDIFEMLNR